MGFLKWFVGGLSIFVLAIAVFAAAARLGDGPKAIFPGGPLEAGALHTGAEPDWTFARDLQEIEFQLVEPPVSRTIWVQVVDGKLYVVSGYMKTAIGKLWKQWPLQAEKDPRAVIRIDGVRYERQVVRLQADDPVLAGISAEVQRKYNTPLEPEMAETGDVWFYALTPREKP